MTENQKRLLYLTKYLLLRDFKMPNLRGITAFWKEEKSTARITFYFDGQISSEDREDASDLCGGIIAQYAEGYLEEEYIQWDYPKPLPEKFLAYKREE